MTSEISLPDKGFDESKERWSQKVINIGDKFSYYYLDEITQQEEIITAVYNGLGVAFDRLCLICSPVDNTEGGKFWEDLGEISIPGFKDREITLEMLIENERGWLFLSSDMENITAIKLGKRRIKATQIPICDLPKFTSSSSEENQ